MTLVRWPLIGDSDVCYSSRGTGRPTHLCIPDVSDVIEWMQEHDASTSLLTLLTTEDHFIVIPQSVQCGFFHTMNHERTITVMLPLVNRAQYWVRQLIVIVFTGWAKKRGHRLTTIILSNLNLFTNFFHWKIPW